MDYLSHHLNGIAVGCFVAIAVILLSPMAMDRHRRWRNRRAASGRAKRGDMGHPPERIDPWVACFTVSASGLTFHDARQVPPATKENSTATVAVVDTATPGGQQTIRGFIGPTAEEVLSVHPGRFVMYTLFHDFTSSVRVSPTEDLVTLEVIKLVRDAPQPPGTVDVLLFLDPVFHQRVTKAVADEVLKRSEAGGTA
jgi:hypothetical protein